MKKATPWTQNQLRARCCREQALMPVPYSGYRLFIFKSPRDIVATEHLLKIADESPVFRGSLIRGASQSVISLRTKYVGSNVETQSTSTSFALHLELFPHNLQLVSHR